MTRRADTYIGMDRFVCRRSSDEGFTLVELVVALTILAVGIVGVIGVTNSGFKVAGTASAKSKMVAAATREIEALRAIPYGELAADRNGDGLPDCGTVTTSPSWSCYSEATKKTGGISYKVQRTIKDYVRPTTSDPDDKHKVAVVAVLWTDQSGPHEVHQSSYIYPGGIGLATSGSTTTVVSSCTPDPPSTLSVSQVLDVVNNVLTVQYTTSLDLSWTITTTGCPVAGYVIRYRPYGSAVWNEVNRVATSRDYRVSGLTAATAYEFQVFTRGPSGRMSTSGSPVTLGTTGAATLNGCLIGTITVTPSNLPKKNGSASSDLDATPSLTMPTNGTCTNYDIVYKKTTIGANTTQQMTKSGSTYTVSVQATGPWDVGSRFIDVVERTSRTKVGSVLFTVCEHNVKTCG